MDVLAGDIEIQLPPDDEDDNPHVRVVGRCAEAVRVASSLVRQELDPPNKVTMKMDVPWNHHSHIIGKGGNTIQPVVKRTGVSIHFPDGNKSNEVKKSNQVSINSRGEELQGLEDARQAIRSLTPLIFTFTLLSSVQFVSVVDANMLLLHVQNTYNVQAEIRAHEDRSLVGSVRGSEWEAQRVKEATHCILQAYCSTLAGQVPIQVAVEVSPQHHAFVLGRNNDNIKRIMHRTSTKIIFPDWNDSNVSPLKKSTITISGALDNVYLALQNVIGCLPLVLMFDLAPGSALEMSEVAQIMQVLDVQIILKSCKMDGRRPVVVKGPEKNADNIYEAWRMLCKVDTGAPKTNVPSTYHLHDPLSKPQTNSDVDVSVGGQWLGREGGSGAASSLPSPSVTPNPHHPHHPNPNHTSLWGGLSPFPTSPLLPLSRPLHLDSVTTSNFYSSAVFRNGGGYGYNNNNHYNNVNNMNVMNNNTALRNENCVMSKDIRICSSSVAGGGINFYSLVKSMKNMELTNGDVSSAGSSGSGSSLSSAAASPRDASPDQALTSSPVFLDTSQHHSQGSEAGSQHSQGIEGLSQHSQGIEGLSQHSQGIEALSQQQTQGIEALSSSQHTQGIEAVSQHQTQGIEALSSSQHSQGIEALSQHQTQDIEALSSSQHSQGIESLSSSQHAQGIEALSALFDRRAPGCEKKHMERVAAQKMTLSDYTSKKVEAARAMKQDVGCTPRTPTSSWSGYGFSKSMPGFMIQQKLQEVKDARQKDLKGGQTALDEWKETWAENPTNNTLFSSSSSTSSSSSSPPLPPFSSTPSSQPPNHNYHSKMQYGLDDKSIGTYTSRPSVNLSTSNYMDSVLPRKHKDPLHTTSTTSSSSSSTTVHSSTEGLDIISILTNLHLPQYIDVFVGQEVDVKMFLSLEDYELKELGISIFGHRKRILMAIKDLSCKTSLLSGTARD